MTIPHDRTVREHLSAGGRMFGVVNRISEPSVCEVLGQAGLDFIMIDGEHAPFSWHDVQARVVAAQSAGLRAFVRPLSAQPWDIGLALDLGADGVHVPHVTSGEQAETVCDAGYYTPMGARGFALSHRGASYGGLAPAEAIEASNSKVTLVLHIEDPVAVERIDEIAACERAGLLFVAPFDLSHGLGVPGDLAAEPLWKALHRVAECARDHGRPCGTYVTDHSRIEELAEMGYQYFLVGADLALLRKGAVDVEATVGRFRR